MVLGDLHLPFSDSKLVTKDAKGLVLDIAEDIGVDRIIVSGDALDFINVSLHGPKHPDIVETLESELNAGREFFESLRKRFPKTHLVYNFGNHTDRLQRFILRHSKPFWNIVTVEKYFRLDEINIEWNKYNYKYQVEKTNLFTQHSPSSYSSPKANLAKKLDQSFIFNCTHRVGSAHLTGGSGTVHSAYFNGWLGSTTETIQHKEVFSYAKGHENWQQGFCIVTVVDEVEFHVNQYLIKNHSVVVDGHLYHA